MGTGSGDRLASGRMSSASFLGPQVSQEKWDSIFKEEGEMKTYRITYSLTFTNDIDIVAKNKREAIKKLKELEEENGELWALDGDDSGYVIKSVEAVKPSPDSNIEQAE